ncbi:MAG: tail fiber domain-containing protein, partial [Candidatus Aenigmatarchaeota archaeon]|nr:tail fiber domain-containing protein [Candidatus Aenigmarchaeota archaeon]
DTLTCGTPSGSSSGWTMSSSYLYNNTAGVRVGIGLTNPSTELEVAGNINASAYYDRQSSQYYLDPSATSIVNNLQVASGTLTGANSESISIGATDNVISFTSGGSERMRIHNSNVGINTTNPNSTLHINGNFSVKTEFNITNSGSVNLKNLYFERLMLNDSYYFESYKDGKLILMLSGTEILRIHNNTYVGIQSINPNNVLQIGDDIGSSPNPLYTFSIGRNAGDAIIQIGRLSSKKGFIMWNATFDHLQINTNSTSDVVFYKVNNVGIETLKPTSKLDIMGNGSTGITLNVSNSFFVNGTGYVGIGTEKPQSILHLNSTNASVWFEGKISDYSYSKFSIGLANGSIVSIDPNPIILLGFPGNEGPNRDFVLRINAINIFQANGRGRVGINVNPSYEFHVYNNSDIPIIAFQDSDGLCTFNPESSATSFACSSDARLKRNIRDAPPVLNELLTIPIKQFEVNSTNETKIGVIAQDILETHPELISKDDKGYYLVSEVSSWKLVKAIQEQQQQINELKKENEMLKKIIYENFNQTIQQ